MYARNRMYRGDKGVYIIIYEIKSAGISERREKGDLLNKKK